MSDDTAFFWEGAERGELLIQRCESCKTLRHPPGPACPACGSFEWDTLAASGRGTIYSYAVHHYPPIPGFDVPNLVGLIELEEGTRVLANVTGIGADEIEIGMDVEVYFADFDGVVLPQFRPVRA
jgi:uncharacterized OB-fold protein